MLERKKNVWTAFFIASSIFVTSAYAEERPKEGWLGSLVPNFLASEERVNIRLDEAIRSCNPDEVTRYLNAGAILNSSSVCNGKALVVAAVECPDAKIAETLVVAGANITAVDDEGNTALHHWARADAFSRYLPAQLNSLVNSQNRRGETPLHIAIESQKPRMIAYLVNFGAKVDIQDAAGRSARALLSTIVKDADFDTLCLFVRTRSLDMAQILTSSRPEAIRAPFQSTQGDECSALHAAAAENDPALVAHYLRVGADVRLGSVGAPEFTPFVAALLQSYSPSDGVSTHEDATPKFIETVTLLLLAGSSIWDDYPTVSKFIDELIDHRDKNEAHYGGESGPEMVDNMLLANFRKRQFAVNKVFEARHLKHHSNLPGRN